MASDTAAKAGGGAAVTEARLAEIEVTAEERQSILNLCGTRGNVEKGVLFLQMNRGCALDAARAAVIAVQREAGGEVQCVDDARIAEIGVILAEAKRAMPKARLTEAMVWLEVLTKCAVPDLIVAVRDRDAALRDKSEALHAAEARAATAEGEVARLRGLGA